VRHELRRAAEELDEVCGQLGARTRLATANHAVDPRRDKRDENAADEEPDRENPGRGRQDGRGDSDACSSDGERNERRPEATNVEALERVDVSDHATQKL